MIADDCVTTNMKIAVVLLTVISCTASTAVIGFISNLRRDIVASLPASSYAIF